MLIIVLAGILRLGLYPGSIFDPFNRAQIPKPVVIAKLAVFLTEYVAVKISPLYKTELLLLIVNFDERLI